jgi:hypothetical protein
MERYGYKYIETILQNPICYTYFSIYWYSLNTLNKMFIYNLTSKLNGMSKEKGPDPQK